MKSFLRWAGSKRSLLGQLRPYWPDDGSRYIEPFCGSACLFFDIRPSRAILGDLNDELIRTMRAVKNSPHLVLEAVRRFRRGKSAYYRLRTTSPATMAEADRAARFVYLNRNCFNGIYRTNQKGEFNVPYGPPRSERGIDERIILGASFVLGNAMIVHGDFEEILAHAQATDFVYLDPPYSSKSRRLFHEYVPGSFSEKDLQRLAAQLKRLDALQAYFVITYADSADARELLGPWRPRRVRVRRHVAGFGRHRRHAYELIASNIPLRT
jgi:DNA adenine methylase